MARKRRKYHKVGGKSRLQKLLWKREDSELTVEEMLELKRLLAIHRSRTKRADVP